MERRSAKEIVAGYRLLREVQRQFPEDSERSNTMGNALYLRKQYGEAVKAFELAVRFDLGSSQKEANLAQACEAAGDSRLAQQHLERASEIDPLNLNAAVALSGSMTQVGIPTRAGS